MTLLTSQTITKYHDNSLAKTFGSSVQANGSDPAKQHGLDEVQYWVAENHLHNCLLWSQEDLARRTCVPDAEIVANKRAIDRHNQSRNDAIERIDECLLLALGHRRIQMRRVHCLREGLSRRRHQRLAQETAPDRPRDLHEMRKLYRGVPVRRDQ